ncbi:MAG: hypoxanthine phosphoribosyltransferase [bacterium]|nr:hypoxanthine phosphoribosyltransferase [bacterium]
MSTNTSVKIENVISKEAIQKKVSELGAIIDAKYAESKNPIILVAVLKGSVIFLADLVRSINIPVEFEFMGVSSYGDSTVSSGVVQITQDLTRSIKGRHVILVEDIVDTGLTAQYLLNNFKTREPASVSLCALLEKPVKNTKNIPIDFLGFSIADDFVVGYGLDYAGLYRNLPYVGKIV